ncbi:MAG: MarR family transcriptional regulator [Rheinheimera sp.]|nr:MAG: MarR family transcriptional regulator [Rheinheimera sp.]
MAKPTTDTTISPDQSCQWPSSALHLDNQLCFALYSTSLAMTKSYKPLLEKLGLTYPQYLIMLILWQQDGVALRDIAEKLHTESGALTPVLKRMQEMGLLIRARSLHSERTLEIRLTDAGRAMQQDALKINQHIALNCGSSLTELAALRDQLIKLRQTLTA